MRLLFNPLAGKQRARRPSRKSPRAWGTDQEIADAAYALLTLNPVQSAGYCTRFNLGLVLLCLLFAAYVLLIQNSGNPNFLVLGLFGALGLIFIPALAISVLGPSAINARPLNYVPSSPRAWTDLSPAPECFPEIRFVAITASVGDLACRQPCVLKVFAGQ